MVKGSVQFGAATGTFTPGTRRLAFALNTSSGAFLYAPTAVYVASGPKSKDVEGPFLAPADPMTVAAQYRSKQNSGPGGIQAIYGAQIRLPHAGTFAVLTLSRTRQGPDRRSRRGRGGRVLADPRRRPACPRDRHRHAVDACTATPRC